MGAISVPCCIMLPIANQKAFFIVNWLSSVSGSSMQGYGLFHSAGHILPTINNNNDTTMKTPIKWIQTSFENGLRKENRLGAALVGFLYNILIPVKIAILSNFLNI